MAVLALAGCAAVPTYPVGTAWDAPPGWRLSVTGMRCGPAATLDPGDPDEQDTCLVEVAYRNIGDRARPFCGTTDEPGPTWRLVGYDAQAGEFHGHARPTAPTPPGGSGTAQLVFEVPTGLRLSRVLVGDAIVRLSG